MASDCIDRKEPTFTVGLNPEALVGDPVEGVKTNAKINVLCVSRDSAVRQMAQRIAEFLPGASVRERVISNGHADPLYGVNTLPDLVIYLQGTEWQNELLEYAARSADSRPPLVVVGNVDDPSALHAALKAHSRDFLSETAEPEEMARALRKIAAEIIDLKRGDHRGNLVAFINARGGSGASVLAANIAHIATVVQHQRSILMDLDLQFGSAGHCLDGPPSHGLREALELTDELDDVALDGYVMKLKSGLHVMSSENRGLVPLDELDEESVTKLLDLLARNYQQVIADLPRHIDPCTTALLERADRIAVVLQQDIASLHDAARLINILRVDLGVVPERITVVVNRYQTRADISLDDIRKTLNWRELITVPNDFRAVSDSINKTSTLYELARKRPITRALEELCKSLTGVDVAAGSGWLARLKAMF